MGEQPHRRESNRLERFYYAQVGAYFVTICTHRRRRLFGEVVNGDMVLDAIGEVVEEEWFRTGRIRSEVRLDEYVVMPNHMHGIIVIQTSVDRDHHVGAHCNAPLRRSGKSLGSIISGFKGAVTRRVRRILTDPSLVVWQRNFYDRIIRDDDELNALRLYIQNNPMRWSVKNRP